MICHCYLISNNNIFTLKILQNNKYIFKNNLSTNFFYIYVYLNTLFIVFDLIIIIAKTIIQYEY